MITAFGSYYTHRQALVKILLMLLRNYCAKIATKKRTHNTNSTGMSVNLVVCVLAFYPYPEPKRAGVSFVGLSKSGRLHPACPHRQDPYPAPRRGQRRGRLSAYAVLPYIFPEYADCQKTLVGASIARPCPFACEKTYPEKALLRQVGGRPLLAPTYSIGHECDFFDTPEYEQELTSKLRWPHKKAHGKHTRAGTALAGNSM